MTNVRMLLLAASLAAGLTLGLSACAGHEPEMTRPDLSAPPEKLVLAALDKVQASDEQRAAVLAAYDGKQGQLTDLARQSREVVGQWHKLDRSAADYGTKAEALAQHWAQLNGDEMRARSAYEQQVASALGPSQWKKWQGFMDDVAAARRHDFLTGMDGLDGRRPQ